ncbi:TIGR03862 family flavoprotein [Methylomonas sp. MgM2]
MSDFSQPSSKHPIPRAVVIGGGPAGLMAAEALSHGGLRVDIYDAMPSFGRKFLQAGVGGLNITHSEDFQTFCTRYGRRRKQLQAMLERLPPSALRKWVHELGIETFVGSSGRVFPKQMKAAPLLRAWLHRLRSTGVHLHARHRWLGWDAGGALRLANPVGEISIKPDVTVLALGGASWPQLGSDGAWVALLRSAGVQIAALQSANCGFEVAWSAYLREKYAGAPLKSVALTFSDVNGQTERRQGELIISANGLEGSLIYAFSQRLREHLHRYGSATLHLDLAPGRDEVRVFSVLNQPHGSRSMSSYLKSRVGLNSTKVALLREVLNKDQFADAALLAKTIKALPITVGATRPLAEAISTAGGLSFSNLDQNLMLTMRPGVFIAGEMLDWEAPTGGYLLTACFATGLWAGLGALNWLNRQ